MEAMTIMGMAASQARFLALTARKSNVEYQGQQINQQRTQLANQSSNLYTQMMDLTVPSPPSSSDFYTTTYTLDGSKEDNAVGDYRITNAYKTYAKAGQYNVTLAYDEEIRDSKNDNYKLEDVEYDSSLGTDNKGLYTIKMSYNAATTELKYDAGDDSALNSSGTLEVTKYNIYKVDDKTGAVGYDEWIASFGKNPPEGQCYFFRDSKNNDNFLTNEEFQKLISTETEKSKDITVGTTYTYPKERTTNVLASIEMSSSGRYSQISIEENSTYSKKLSGVKFGISTSQVKDDDAYNDAYNDYQYSYHVYQQRLSEINAQTEILQNKDQQLELRLQQLDTEQNAIKTEMDSVQKVIEDNIEKTFKAFA